MAERIKATRPDASVIRTITVVLPFTLALDNCQVKILEVAEYAIANKRGYLVSCQAKCGEFKSPVFFLDVKSYDELKWKLKVELAKFKLLQME